MTTVQKVIKGLAIALAVFIIFSIVSAIASAFFAIEGTKWLIGSLNEEMVPHVEETFNIEDIKNINLVSGIEEIKILTGDEFKVIGENVPKSFTCSVENETLNITSNGKTKFSFKSAAEIKIYIPKEFIFENAQISLGVGESTIESLLTENLDLTCGAGEVEIRYIEATKSATISCGVGEFTIKDSKLNDLDFNAGVGENKITSVLTGKCSIDQGVGETRISLKEFDEEKGKITTQKGIGELRVNRKQYSGSQTFGHGEDVTIDISGGIGEINIEY